jgi:hypothetical protein
MLSYPQNPATADRLFDLLQSLDNAISLAKFEASTEALQALDYLVSRRAALAQKLGLSTPPAVDGVAPAVAAPAAPGAGECTNAAKRKQITLRGLRAQLFAVDKVLQKNTYVPNPRVGVLLMRRSQLENQIKSLES